MSLDVELHGVVELVHGTEAAAQLLTDLPDAAGDAGALVLAGVNTPRRTGRLDATVQLHVDGAGFTITAGGPGAPYGPPVEARTGFLALALIDNEQQLLDTYANHVRAAAQTITGS